MSRLLIPGALALAAATGCISETGHPAPAFALLSSPGDITLTWHQDYNGVDDGIGSLFLLDFMVYDSESAIPLENIRLELLSGYGGMYLIPKTAVKIVPYPPLTEDERAANCDVDGDGYIDDDAPDKCSWHWDTSGDVYFELASDFANAYHPNYLIGATDNRGIFRSYIYVDSLPSSSGTTTGEDGEETDGETTFQAVQVSASIGVDSAEVSLGPSQN
jgi:hypothetical protein